MIVKHFELNKNLIENKKFFLLYGNNSGLIKDIIQTKHYKKNLNPICGYQFPEIQKFNKKNLTPVFLKYFLPWGWCVNSNYWKKYLSFINKEKNIKIKDTIIKKIETLTKGKSKNIWSKNFIRFNLVSNKRIIFPNISLIKNIGFDGSGVNSKITNKLSTKYVKTKNKSKLNKISSNQKLVSIQAKVLNKRLRYFF